MKGKNNRPQCHVKLKFNFKTHTALCQWKIPHGIKLPIIRPVYKNECILPSISHMTEKYLAKVMKSFSGRYSLVIKIYIPQKKNHDVANGK